jgi:CxxC-x17-CxxC domain-containing protein
MQQMYENRKMFDAECEDCGNEISVPFKPDGKRPVYCKNCLIKNKGRKNQSFKKFSHNKGGRKMRYEEEDDFEEWDE